MIDTKLKESQTSQDKNTIHKRTSKNIENKKMNRIGTKSTSKTADASLARTKTKNNDLAKKNQNTIFEDNIKDKNNFKDKEKTNILLRNNKNSKKKLDKNLKYKLLFLNIITFYIFQLYLNSKIKKHTKAKEDDPKINKSPKSNNNQKDLKHSSKIPFDIQKLIEYLGGVENIESTDASLNSLQIFLKNKNEIDKDGIKKLGAKGLIVSKEKISIIFGDYSMTLKDELKQLIKTK